MKEYHLPGLGRLHFSEGERSYFGATQQFYQSFYQRSAGCGPTTAANQLTYLSGLKSSLAPLFPWSVVNKKTMLLLMNALWRFIPVTPFGLYKIEHYKTGVLLYAESVGVSLEGKTLAIHPAYTMPNLEVVTFWLLDALQRNSPVAFLNLDAGEVREISRWHWVTIVGISYKKDELFATVYDGARKKTVDLALWLRTTKYSGGFVSIFKREECRH